MAKLSAYSLQQLIDASPREHAPTAYKVHIFDRKERYLRTVYVRASSPRRARLTGLRVARHVFSQSDAVRASAAPNVN